MILPRVSKLKLLVRNALWKEVMRKPPLGWYDKASSKWKQEEKVKHPPLEGIPRDSLSLSIFLFLFIWNLHLVLSDYNYNESLWNKDFHVVAASRVHCVEKRLIRALPLRWQFSKQYRERPSKESRLLCATIFDIHRSHVTSYIKRDADLVVGVINSVTNYGASEHVFSLYLVYLLSVFKSSAR